MCQLQLQILATAKNTQSRSNGTLQCINPLQLYSANSDSTSLQWIEKILKKFFFNQNPSIPKIKITIFQSPVFTEAVTVEQVLPYWKFCVKNIYEILCS